MAVDENVADAVKLAAIRDALDRAGLSARTAVSVAIAPKPWEVIFDDIVGGSRAESRRGRGVPDDNELDTIESRALPALVGSSDPQPIVDADVIEPEPESTAPRSTSNAARSSHAPRRTYTIRDFERS